MDFIRGAALSQGGKPIIALPSTAAGGHASRIVPALKPGAGVVTTRGHVHWVVTEYGAVNLFGLTLRQRAEALISIAHPDFRGELRARLRAGPPRRARILAWPIRQTATGDSRQRVVTAGCYFSRRMPCSCRRAAA